MKACVVLNQEAGVLNVLGEAAVPLVESRLAHQGIGTADIACVSPHEVAAAVRRALEHDCDFVLVGGGDGTLRTAASVLVGSDRPLAIVPLGTFNHFARDLGVPAKPLAAIDALATAVPRQVDVGELNGHIFLNNSSLGIYPEAVRMREVERRRTGASKLFAFSKAMVRALARLPQLDVRVVNGAGELTRTTPFVFIANNAYDLRLHSFGRRPHLDRGELCIYLGDRLSRRDLMRLLARGLAGRLDGSARLHVLRSTEALVDPVGRDRVRVSLDGEVLKLEPPLCYRSLPRALKVLVPSETYVGG